MARKLKIDTGAKVFAPYSPGITVKDHIWLSGQVGVDGGDSIEGQTHSALSKIDDLLLAANSSRADLVKVVILLSDMSDLSMKSTENGWGTRCLLPERRIKRQVSLWMP